MDGEDVVEEGYIMKGQSIGEGGGGGEEAEREREKEKQRRTH